MIGPKGLERVVSALRIIAPELPFEIRYLEIEGASQHFSINGYEINAFRVNHNVLCYGYTLEIKRAGLFRLEEAMKLPIPRNYWGRLQRGETVEYEGQIYTPDLVMGPPRKGIKLTYCTDTRPTKAMAEFAAGSDLAILEGMYAEPDKLEKARQYKHMTFYEAAHVAKDAQVQELWLTHFSPSLVRGEDYMDKVRGIFPNASLGKDGRMTELTFKEDEK
jgi:ribonuclease Z